MRLKASRSKTVGVRKSYFQSSLLTKGICIKCCEPNNKFFHQESAQGSKSEAPKPDSKKRGRPKKAANDDEVDTSLPKKAKRSSSQRTRVNENEDNAEDMEPQQAASGFQNGQGNITAKAKGSKGTLKGKSETFKRADMVEERLEQRSVKASGQKSKSKKKRESGATRQLDSHA